LYCLQAQQRRILQLEGEVEALRVESGRQQEALMQQRSQTRAAEARIQELQQELENNAGAARLERRAGLHRASRSVATFNSFALP
jgi:TolA-binding protein